VPREEPEAGSPCKNYDIFSDFHGSGVNTLSSYPFLWSSFFEIFRAYFKLVMVGLCRKHLNKALSGICEGDPSLPQRGEAAQGGMPT
jgi:hypothetical protein